MKKKVFILLGCSCTVVILLSLWKSLKPLPTQSNMWHDDGVSELISQDSTLTDFDIYQSHFQFIEASYSKSIGTMLDPGTQIYDEPYVIDSSGTIISDHYFLLITYAISNLTQNTLIHDTGNIRLLLFDDGAEVGAHEFYFNNFSDDVSSKQYRILYLKPQETRTVTLGLIISPEELTAYDLAIAVNPTGRAYQTNPDRVPIMTDVFRFFVINPLNIGGE